MMKSVCPRAFTTQELESARRLLEFLHFRLLSLSTTPLSSFARHLNICSWLAAFYSHRNRRYT